MDIRTILRNFGLKTVGIYSYRGYLHIFFSDSTVRDKDVADCIKVPIYINGIKYNF